VCSAGKLAGEALDVLVVEHCPGVLPAEAVDHATAWPSPS